MLPKAVNEVHDLPALNAALGNGIQQTEVHADLMRPHGERLLLVELALKLLRSQPMCGVTVGESRGDALLILGIRSVPEMEKKSRHLALLRRGERRYALLDVFDAHENENTNDSLQSNRADSPTPPSLGTGVHGVAAALWAERAASATSPTARTPSSAATPRREK